MPTAHSESKSSSTGYPVFACAKAYHAAGLSMVPVARAGSKQPDFPRLPRELKEDGKYRASWEPMKQQLPSLEWLKRWFACEQPSGIGIIGGVVSGGLETLDFDVNALVIFPAWCGLVEAEAPGLVARLSVAKTPKPGFHARYRCPDLVDFPG